MPNLTWDVLKEEMIQRCDDFLAITTYEQLVAIKQGPMTAIEYIMAYEELVL